MAELLPEKLWENINQEIPEYELSFKGGRSRARC